MTRALDEEQKNLFNIISGNFEISKQNITHVQDMHGCQLDPIFIEDKLIDLED